MGLFVACVLIYHFSMPWWWYGVAALIWLITDVPRIVRAWD